MPVASEYAGIETILVGMLLVFFFCVQKGNGNQMVDIWEGGNRACVLFDDEGRAGGHVSVTQSAKKCSFPNMVDLQRGGGGGEEGGRLTVWFDGWMAGSRGRA
uniref:Putative secreted protein n=1 Tax=Anopheles darlingi TaxID=43151 RepID=A0A2M4DHU2_ANODA